MLTDTRQVKLASLIILLMLFPILGLFSFLAPQEDTSAEGFNYRFADKIAYRISFSTVSPDIHSLAADSGNGLVVKVQINSESGAGVPYAGVKLYSSDSIGSFNPSKGVTDKYGNFISVYSPPSSIVNQDTNTKSASAAVMSDDNIITLTSRLSGTDKTSSIQIRLVTTPIVFLHGYQCTPDIFSETSKYLEQKGFISSNFSYSSEKGVVPASYELSSYLQQLAADYRSNGIQVGRFDLISHSMGGLVARYYTCSSEYAAQSDVRKLIFVSVPQKGSLLASLGLHYFDDSGIRDMVTDSVLYSTSFPSMINSGLNPSIQTGSLLGRYDEVVSAVSASLAEWSIDTEIFDIGDSNFTFDKLLSGEILQADNHKLILNNNDVCSRIEQMLTSDMPYPSIL